MVLDIITIDDEVNNILHTKCKEISLEDLKKRRDWYVELADSMLDTIKSVGALGLAANQVGASLRMFALADDTVILNPKIVAKSNMITSHEEGCLSVPGKRFNIRRAKNLVVRGIDLDGNEITLRPKSKMVSIAIQHEMDHLNGFTLKDLGKEVE